MNLKRLFFLSTVTILLVVSCKRYDEGPGLSLRFKETRIAGVWNIDKFDVDGISALDSGLMNDSLSYIEFTKGGFYEIVNEHPNKFGVESGIWHMGSGWKGKDYMEVDKNDRLVNYYIIKLKNNNIKYEYDDVGKDGKMHHYVVHLTPKVL